MKPAAAEITALTNVVIDTFREILGKDRLASLLKDVDNRLDAYAAAMPHDYGQEIKGIAAATGIEPSIMFIYNYFYSVFGACTSILAEGPNGSQYHVRNLDFGLWPSFNISHGNLWKMTSALRPLVINLDMKRNGTTLYKQTTFKGFVGTHTALKPDVISVTIDTRFDKGFDSGLIEWLAFPKLDHSTELTLAVRSMIERSDSYEAALATINQTELLGPAYIILGSPKSGQGAVVVKGETKFLHEGNTVEIDTLEAQIANGSSFLVQTNYDGDVTGDKPASRIDDRRDPAKKCMKQLGQAGTGFAGLYNLLSSTPNLNALTAYTTLMNIQTGEFEAYRQICDTLDCPLF